MSQAIHPPLQSPPHVPGMPFIGSAPAFLAANGIPVSFLQHVQRQHGDLAHFTVMSRSFYLVSDPELVHDILVTRVQSFHKPEAIAQTPRGLSRFLGSGILTAGHEQWRPQRKLIQPFMHARHIERYAETMACMGERLLSHWQDGSERDIHADMTHVTMWIIAETMFGVNLNHSPSFEDAANSAQKIVIEDLISLMPAWLTGRDAETERVNTVLTELVKGFVAQHNANPNPDRHDLLSLLLATRDEDGQPMSEEFLRNNILTMFFAGHETTANTLTWAHYYLSQNPAILKRLQDEVDAVLPDGRLPTLADLPNLPYTLMVIKETMRQQPTVATFPRVITEDVELGGYLLKAGSFILISPYVLHHDARHWADPNRYDPERFSEKNERRIPKYAYLPFGGGPRICIGNHFALMEAHILLALMVRRYQLHLSPNAKIEPKYHVTVSPKHGLPMRLQRRA